MSLKLFTISHTNLIDRRATIGLPQLVVLSIT